MPLGDEKEDYHFIGCLGFLLPFFILGLFFYLLILLLK